VKRVDDGLAALVPGLARGGRGARTPSGVVSDHGMIETHTDRRVFLSDYVNLADVEIVDSGPLVAVNPTPRSTTDALYRQLAGRHASLDIYRRESLPARLRYGSHPRVPAIVGLVEPGWHVAAARPPQSAAPAPRIGGAHGYAPWHRDMQGLFVAAGPRIRPGLVVPAFENIHVYELLCAVLGITPADNDGSAAVTRPMLQEPRALSAVGTEPVRSESRRASARR
jgi:predicted AlkP superfamily pyrophosphatase or phosphodiesterase